MFGRLLGRRKVGGSWCICLQGQPGPVRASTTTATAVGTALSHAARGMQGSETDEGDKKVYKKADLGAKNTLYYNEEVGAHP